MPTSPRSIYLDHNATTPLLPAVAEAMARCQSAPLANPASLHAPGRRARQWLEDAREAIAEILNLRLTPPRPDVLIFTSGGTEANNLALFGLGIAGERRLPLPAARGGVAISAIEHPSITLAADELKRCGVRVETLRVKPDGQVDVAALEALLTEEVGTGVAMSEMPDSLPGGRQPLRLVSVMLGNNETGVLQPVAELAPLCRAAGLLLHTDAVQVAGKLPIDFQALGVDALSLAAHKFHGPPGIGALAVRGGVPLAPRLFGGFQQGGMRPGTEGVALAVGMAAALRLWRDEADARLARLTALRERLAARIRQAWPSAVVHGEAAPRLPHTLNVAFPGWNRQTLVMALDLAGVACSSGSACASGSTDPSPTLTAMGLPAEFYESSIRFSLGATTTEEEIEEAARRIATVLARQG